jgi:hypothetical protein
MPKFTINAAGQTSPPSGSGTPAPPAAGTCTPMVAAFLTQYPFFASSTPGDNGMTSTGWFYFFKANPTCQQDSSLWISSLTNTGVVRPPTTSPTETCTDQINAFIAANPQFVSTTPGDNGLTAIGWAQFFQSNQGCASDATVWTAQLPTTPVAPAPPVGLIPPGQQGTPGSTVPPAASDNGGGALLFGAAVLGLIFWAGYSYEPARTSTRRSSRRAYSETML